MHTTPPSPIRLPMASMDGEIYHTLSSPRPQRGTNNFQSVRERDSASTTTYSWGFDTPPSAPFFPITPFPSSTTFSYSYTAVEEDDHVSESTFFRAPTIQNKKHGLYCRLKTFLRALLQSKLNTTEGKFCKHEQHHDKCNGCAIRMGNANSEPRLVYVYCEDPDCPFRKRCTRDPVNGTYGSEEDMRVAVSNARHRMCARLMVTSPCD